jgi:hypothetical protein
MEYWNNGIMGSCILFFAHHSISPVFQYSNLAMGFPGKKKGAPGAPFGQA